MKKVKKFLPQIIAVVAVFTLVISFSSIAKATQEHVDQADECFQEFDYTKSSDFDDSRVNINFQDDDQAITVIAKTGYELVSVQLGVEDDGHNGYWAYAVISGEKFNPNPGEDINVAKVKVRMVCVSSSPSPSVSPSAGGATTNIRMPKTKVSPQVLGTTAPTPTPSVQVAGVLEKLPVSGKENNNWFYYLLIVATLGFSIYLKNTGWQRVSR